MPSGIILKGYGGFYYVKADEEIYECKARGIFRKDGMNLYAGDRVVFSVIDDAKKIGNIDEIKTRETQLIRPAVANVNQIAIVVSVKSPGPDFYLLDKLLITARLKDIDCLICINKIDLDELNEAESIIDAYNKAGYKLIKLSSKENIGFSELEKELIGKITVLAGQSGVGKSTILNYIMESIVMKTGDISEKIDRGKHTTRHAELLELKNGGYFVDTPGFSSFELSDIEGNELENYYPEFDNYLNKCKFTGCSHITEPGCSVKEALGESLIDAGRYERYIEFYNMLKQKTKSYKK